MALVDRIRALEKAARRLEPGPAQRKRLLERVDAYAEEFLQGLPQASAYGAAADEGAGLLDAPLTEEGMGVEAVLDLLRENLTRPGVNPASPRFLGYIPGGGLYPSALGDFLAAVTNRYAGIFFASPGAVRMENMLLRWMAEIVGYPATGAGNLTSGGSIATLTGIVTARDKYQIEAEAVPRAVVYLTEHTHHSVDKALRIAGLGRCVVRRVPVDDRFRMQAPALADAIAQDEAAGLRPWLVVAAAGTTNTGSVDPLPAIADIVQDHDLWLHVDGAYGAFFVLCDEGKKILQGMDRSDSLVMDPHKTLFLPYGTGAILVKDRQQVFASHHYLADYMQDVVETTEELSPADLSPELTKHFRGLRLWLPLQLFGIAPFRAALAEKMLLARYFHTRLQEVDGFEVGPSPDLSVVIYRYVPRRGDPDAFNEALAKALQEDGRVFVSTTVVRGKFVLRLAVGVFRTHLEHIDQTIDILVETARRLEETV